LRGATATTTSSVVHALFQPMRPLRGATAPLWRRSRRSRISTHAPLAGRDGEEMAALELDGEFQPTRPLRGATRLLRGTVFSLDFNPRAPCGARPQPTRERAKQTNFNPRAPCGARPKRGKCLRVFSKISTHAPLAGRDGNRKDTETIL